MANFCKYCGKALQDGEICTCPQAQAEAAQQYNGPSQQDPQGYPPPQGSQGYPPQQDPQGYPPPQGPQGYPPQQDPQGYPPPQGPQGYPPQTAGPSPVAVGLKKIPDFLKSYIKAPVRAVQALVNAKDVIVAGILLCVQVIISGLLLFAGMDSLFNSDSKIAGLVGSGLVSINDLSLWDIREPTFGMSFLMGLLLAVICIAVYVAIIFAAAKISGAQTTFVDAVVAAGGHSLCVTGLLLLSFIAFFIMFELGAILLVAAMLTWVVLTPPAVQSIAPPNATKEGTLWICMALGVAIAVVACGWISSMILAIPMT